ncbi:MAG TPA: isoleucine--tRNA ligase [Candidatus Norongarragalinales archaeon]|nr:isoleucine--tRNA ligase [Candidatus Norongarragalinales archaeon]
MRADYRKTAKLALGMLTYDQKEIERSMLDFWEKNRIPQKLAQLRPNAKPFFLLDGPPYANAQPHVGHVKTTVCKDIWSRFKQMKGFKSYFQAGFDCHGLPTEVMVEKELGIQSKGDIEKIGIAKFDALCQQKVLNTEKGWMDYYRMLGAWRYYAEPYFTYKDYYIESGWWTVKQLHEKGLLVEGEKPVYWCPHCETTLSGYEVSDSYKDVPDPSVFVKFKVKGRQNEYLVVWTTTPWTLVANVAIVVHPDENYLRMRVGNEILIVAEKRAYAVIKEKLGLEYDVQSQVLGADLDGLEYEPLLDVPQQKLLDGRARKVHLSIPIMTSKKYKKHKLVHRKTEESTPIRVGANAGMAIVRQSGKPEDNAPNLNSTLPGAAIGIKDADKLTGTEEREEYEEFVTMAEGTGLVHCAPGHGQTDFMIGKYYGLPAVSPVDEHGFFTENAGEFSGMFVKKANEAITLKLGSENKLLHSEQITHRAALCWRCKTPLIFRLSKQWYLKVEPIKDLMISENEHHVSWLPEYGKVKFHNWLVDREDWAISQQRYWGIPLPIWICGQCGKFDVIGSRDELRERAVTKLPQNGLTDLHRHIVDGIDIKCSNCSGTMRRVKDILNVWFDSGIAPWASLGYPFKNKQLFESMFPMNLITESQDQIRGWFDSLMFTSVGVFGKAPYKTVAMMGWVLDEKGEKMSKSLGNVIPATEGISKLSADVIRMYYCYEIAPWEVQKFSYKTAEEVKRAYAILFNIYAFYETYSKGIEVEEPILAGMRPEDGWIVSKLNILKQRASDHLEKFEFHFAGRELIKFIVDDFSRTYIKLVRDRVSSSNDAADQAGCLSIIRHVLYEYSKLLAPISPFISEYLYQKLSFDGEPQSVHFLDYPSLNEKEVDLKLVEMFETGSKITEAANSLRQELKFKLRWPLEALLVSGDDKSEEAAKIIGEVLKVSNNAEQVEYGERQDYASKEFEGGKVWMPKILSDKTILHAAHRELSRAIQAARKKNSFVVSDRIRLVISTEDSALRAYLNEIKEPFGREVGAASIEMKVQATDLKGDIEIVLDLSELRPNLRITAVFSKIR